LVAATPSELGAPGSAPVTRTFAARDDIEVWTRKLSSAPAPLPSTPAAAPGSLRISALGTRALDVAGVGESSGTSTSGSIGSPGGNAGFALLAVCSAAFIAAAFAWSPAPATAPRALAAKRALEPAVALPPAPDSAQSASPNSPPTRPSAPPPNARLTPQKPDEAPRSRGPSGDASAAPDQLGVLKITADPRAEVEVSGAHFHQLGQTPIVGLKLVVGKYQIVFRNDTFGAPVTAQVMVVAGGSRSVHADFRQAEPAVSVR
jgi:hypothetical protein